MNINGNGNGNTNIITNTENKAWICSDEDKHRAGGVMSGVFVTCLLAMIGSGILTLAFSPNADMVHPSKPKAHVKIASGIKCNCTYPFLVTQVSPGQDIPDDAKCLRVARRADTAIVIVGIGNPRQELKLLLRLDRAVTENEPSVLIFSERVLKSVSIRCTGFFCSDQSILYVNGTDEQERTRVQFQYMSENEAYVRSVRAQLMGLHGEFHLVLGHSYWMTSTHICWTPAQYETELSGAALPAVLAQDGTLVTSTQALSEFVPLADTPAAKAATGMCANLSGMERNVQLFPVDAGPEATVWLVLSSNFLYEYGNDILLQRREVVEIGSACAEIREDLKLVESLYQLDCKTHEDWSCRTTAALPYRRIANSRVRIDIFINRTALIQVESTAALSMIPSLVSYKEDVSFALVRLAIMVLTAAVVFVRGTRDACSSTFMLLHRYGLLLQAD
jgi:hypothetical protein